jgi:hypothetical protein
MNVEMFEWVTNNECSSEPMNYSIKMLLLGVRNFSILSLTGFILSGLLILADIYTNIKTFDLRFFKKNKEEEDEEFLKV